MKKYQHFHFIQIGVKTVYNMALLGKAYEVTYTDANKYSKLIIVGIDSAGVLTLKCKFESLVEQVPPSTNSSTTVMYIPTIRGNTSTKST
jgi:hypothetical protein